MDIPQGVIKEKLTKNLTNSKLKLIYPRPDFNMYIGKLGDALLKKVEEPLGLCNKLGKALFSLACSS